MNNRVRAAGLDDVRINGSGVYVDVADPPADEIGPEPFESLTAAPLRRRSWSPT